MKFTVILEPETDGGYSVICPAIPGCVSQGHSLNEALANIREAILLCLKVRSDEGLAAPDQTPEIVAEKISACLKDRAQDGLPLTIETRRVEVEPEEGSVPRERGRPLVPPELVERIRLTREDIRRRVGHDFDVVDMVRRSREGSR